MPSIARMAVQLSPDDRHAPSSQRGGQGFESPQLHRGVFPEFGETILRNPGLVRVRGQTCPMAPDHWSGAISGTGRLTDLIAVAGGSWWARPCFGEDLGGLEAEPGWAHGRGGDRFVDYVLGGDHDKPRALPEAKGARRDGIGGQQQARYARSFWRRTCRRRPTSSPPTVKSTGCRRTCATGARGAALLYQGRARLGHRRAQQQGDTLAARRRRLRWTTYPRWRRCSRPTT